MGTLPEPAPAGATGLGSTGATGQIAAAESSGEAPATSASTSSPDSKPFDYAQAQTSLLVTLSTGITTLTLTFYKNFSDNPSHDARTHLIYGWICFVISVCFGILTYGAITGGYAKRPERGIYKSSIQVFAILQMLTFVIATALVVWGAANAIDSPVIPKVGQ